LVPCATLHAACAWGSDRMQEEGSVVWSASQPRAGCCSRGELPALPLALLPGRGRRFAKEVAVAARLRALGPERAPWPAVVALWPQIPQCLQRYPPQHGCCCVWGSLGCTALRCCTSDRQQTCDKFAAALARILLQAMKQVSHCALPT